VTTLTTLFGGLVAVFALYALGGLVRTLSPALRAALAGLVPLVGYFAVIVGRWPGLDVVAIHISVFLAAALVLFALTQFRRRGAGRMHWAPKLLAGFFVALVLINAAFLHIATRGLPEPIARWWLGSEEKAVYSGFSGVVEHGRSAAKTVSSELSEAHRESQLGWQVEVHGLDGSGRMRHVEVRIRDRTGLPVDRVDAVLQLQRPGAGAPAMTLPLTSDEAGVYRAVLGVPAAGRWLATLQLTLDGAVHYRITRELVAS
jgi:nitrogen fixation protein FixH